MQYTIATSRIILTPHCAMLRGAKTRASTRWLLLRWFAGRFSERERVKRDLSDIAGTWQEDPAFDSAIQEQRKSTSDLAMMTRRESPERSAR